MSPALPQPGDQLYGNVMEVRAAGILRAGDGQRPMLLVAYPQAFAQIRYLRVDRPGQGNLQGLPRDPQRAQGTVGKNEEPGSRYPFRRDVAEQRARSRKACDLRDEHDHIQGGLGQDPQAEAREILADIDDEGVEGGPQGAYQSLESVGRDRLGPAGVGAAGEQVEAPGFGAREDAAQRLRRVVLIGTLGHRYQVDVGDDARDLGQRADGQDEVGDADA